VKLKLSVFTLSAAIAGLGGIFLATALGSVSIDNYIIFISLALVMLTVVFGINYVSGALIGGIASGVGFALVVATFNHLADNHVSLHGLYATLAHIAAVAPALIGIGVGRSPSGSVHDFVESYRPMRDAKPVLAAGAATEALLYGLALAGVLTNWWFVILTLVLLLVLPLIGRMAMPAAFLPAEELARLRGTVPLELQGIDAPYTTQLRDALDRAVGIDPTVEQAAALVGADGNGSGARSPSPAAPVTPPDAAPGTAAVTAPGTAPVTSQGDDRAPS
jgi:hypothetical protein